MVSFNLRIKSSFPKDLRPLPKTIILKAMKLLVALQTDPYSEQTKKLVGEGNLYRARLGDYRLIYEIDEAEKEVTVYYLRHRRDVYRQL